MKKQKILNLVKRAFESKKLTVPSVKPIRGKTKDLVYLDDHK